MSLGGPFKEVTTFLQLMESAASMASVSATSKKHISAAIDLRYYCVWEATNGMCNSKQSDPI
ncbi:hypothetical protein PGT21_014581, partial [Puccinia graminis f. sp. tritici]